ncbi:unnamed protein product [Candida verbasci]|uniref:Ubiquitin carboxyl-terminal hydrolase n=1 Tax=Candida verbasci TaxID=1227364 RepID=A0A9W4TSY8_9ASCO|nr:unnamed protein product [Candida verbasci]
MDLQYGDGSHKIFGMENFGNTCYCNSILQCLYYTENFRIQLVKHKLTTHDQKLKVSGVKPHGFTTKYDQLVQKRLREQGKTNEERPKSNRKGSIFGLKFNSPSVNVVENKNNYIIKAKNCDSISLEQRIKISKSREFQKLDLFVTRPSNQVVKQSNRNDYSQSSSMLLNDVQQQTDQEGSINSNSSVIIVGIPKPEINLLNPVNPFNANPNSDQRKRSALINGPIINLDTSLQLPTEQKDFTALLYALKDLFESMIENQSTIGVVSPNYFIAKLKEKNHLFRQNNMHHDAHEFFNYLINEIIESLNKVIGVENNWCNDIFQGLITNETKCLLCETVTSKHEFFLDLSIDIPPGEGAYSLNHSLNNFSKMETLTNQNKFYCNTCSSLQEAVKTIRLKKLPQVLVINLKRFKYDEVKDKMVKLFDSISYPPKLRLFSTSDEQHLLYELYALVIHIGGGPMHGHYVSICKIKAGLWLLFDDETVELVEDSYVMRFFGNGPGLASAYILFYQKCVENEEYGFDPDSIYTGDDNSILSMDDIEDLPNNVEVESENSSIASSEPPPKKDVFKNFKFTNGDEESTGKKSWVGSLKRKDPPPPLERNASTSSTTSQTEKRKSIFGFRKK